jgi:hypothetical protein
MRSGVKWLGQKSPHSSNSVTVTQFPNTVLGPGIRIKEMPVLNRSLTRRGFFASSVAPVLAMAAANTPEVNLLAVPQNGIQPQAVVDSSGVIHLIYLFGDPAAADIGYVRKRPGDSSFTAPVRVNDQPGSAIALGTVRGARLAMGDGGRLHVAWNGSSKAAPKGSNGSAPMLYTRLASDGGSFEPQRAIMPSVAGLDGGGAVAADNFGTVYVACHAMGRSDGRPAPGEGHRRVWLARSIDNGETFEPERVVSPPETGACGCCGMGALADTEGNLYLMYRTARAIVHRDMYLLVSRDRGQTFEATDLQPWDIAACPMSTVSLVQSGDQILFSWETDKQVYFSKFDLRSRSAGKAIPAPGAGKIRKHPAIAQDRHGRVLLSWTDGTGWKRGGMLDWQMFNTQSQPVGPPCGGDPVPVWGMPAAVCVNGRFFVIC